MKYEYFSSTHNRPFASSENDKFYEISSESIIWNPKNEIKNQMVDWAENEDISKIVNLFENKTMSGYKVGRLHFDQLSQF